MARAVHPTAGAPELVEKFVADAGNALPSIEGGLLVAQQHEARAWKDEADARFFRFAAKQGNGDKQEYENLREKRVRSAWGHRVKSRQLRNFK